SPPSIAARTCAKRSSMLESSLLSTATVTLPGSHLTCASSLASHEAWQSTFALGARTSPVQYGSSNFTLQPPRHSPSQLALALATHEPSHEPLQPAEQLPLHSPLHEPLQLPSALVAEHLPSHAPSH